MLLRISPVVFLVNERVNIHWLKKKTRLTCYQSPQCIAPGPVLGHSTTYAACLSQYVSQSAGMIRSDPLEEPLVKVFCNSYHSRKPHCLGGHRGQCNPYIEGRDDCMGTGHHAPCEVTEIPQLLMIVGEYWHTTHRQFTLFKWITWHTMWPHRLAYIGNLSFYLHSQIYWPGTVSNTVQRL